MPRRLSRRRVLFGGTAALLLAGCGGGSTIAELETLGDAARPGRRGVAEPVRVQYRLRRPAQVSIGLSGPNGRTWRLRSGIARVPGEEYELPFDGTVPKDALGDRNVLPDGTYELKLTAVEPDGQRDERAIHLRVEGADTAPLELEGPSLSLEAITPDGDGVDDEVRVELALSKPAQVEVWAQDENGNRATILPPTRRDPGPLSLVWDGSAGGRVFGGKRLADGDYQIMAEARDEAGNVRVRKAPLRIANGGIERLEIAEVTMEPTRLRVGEQLRLRVGVVNTGETTIRTMGPPPGTVYTTKQSFSTIEDPTGKPYPLVSGAWRIGLGWEDSELGELPVRWGILADPEATLPPGSTAQVEGVVTIELSPSPGRRFWVGAIREGIGLETGRVGDQVIAVLP